MHITLTDEQRRIVNEAVRWYHKSSEQVFQFAGNPGTGKSVVLGAINQELGLNLGRVAPMAYVGAAAIQMRLKGLINAKTIHSWLYEVVEVPVLNEHGQPLRDSFYNKPITEMQFIPRELDNIDLMEIDEAGTVPMSMKADIESRNKKIIAAGDLDQLKPVGDNPAYLNYGKVYELHQIMRQAENSPIIYLSQRAKNGLPIDAGLYGNAVLVCYDDEVTDDMLRWAGVVLCGRNKTRENITNDIRHRILGKTTDYPTYGEKMICRKNNWNESVGGINLTNGLTGTVINNPDPSTFDGKSYTIDFLPDLTNTPFYGVTADYEYLVADPANREIIKKSRYNPGNKFEFGYAQTVHLAQGNQWTHGIFFEEYMMDSTNRVNYVAITRFSNSCIYVKRRPKFRSFR